jgi:hypothetical protein
MKKKYPDKLNKKGSDIFVGAKKGRRGKNTFFIGGGFFSLSTRN